ncbi:MAG: hypothetical protein DRI61_10555 [Chloroflexi bacterium]|nr:MAG: hypothetical protein DRI61_10555 [Chloroflexota bacterium]
MVKNIQDMFKTFGGAKANADQLSKLNTEMERLAKAVASAIAIEEFERRLRELRLQHQSLRAIIDSISDPETRSRALRFFREFDKQMTQVEAKLGELRKNIVSGSISVRKALESATESGRKDIQKLDRDVLSKLRDKLEEIDVKFRSISLTIQGDTAKQLDLLRAKLHAIEEIRIEGVEKLTKESVEEYRRTLESEKNRVTEEISRLILSAYQGARAEVSNEIKDLQRDIQQGLRILVRSGLDEFENYISTLREEGRDTAADILNNSARTAKTTSQIVSNALTGLRTYLDRVTASHIEDVNRMIGSLESYGSASVKVVSAQEAGLKSFNERVAQLNTGLNQFSVRMKTDVSRAASQLREEIEQLVKSISEVKSIEKVIGLLDAITQKTEELRSLTGEELKVRDAVEQVELKLNELVDARLKLISAMSSKTKQLSALEKLRVRLAQSQNETASNLVNEILPRELDLVKEIVRGIEKPEGVIRFLEGLSEQIPDEVKIAALNEALIRYGDLVKESLQDRLELEKAIYSWQRDIVDLTQEEKSVVDSLSDAYNNLIDEMLNRGAITVQQAEELHQKFRGVRDEVNQLFEDLKQAKIEKEFENLNQLLAQYISSLYGVRIELRTEQVQKLEKQIESLIDTWYETEAKRIREEYKGLVGSGLDEMEARLKQLRERRDILQTLLVDLHNSADEAARAAGEFDEAMKQLGETASAQIRRGDYDKARESLELQTQLLSQVLLKFREIVEKSDRKTRPILEKAYKQIAQSYMRQIAESYKELSQAGEEGARKHASFLRQMKDFSSALDQVSRKFAQTAKRGREDTEAWADSLTRYLDLSSKVINATATVYEGISNIRETIKLYRDLERARAVERLAQDATNMADAIASLSDALAGGKIGTFFKISETVAEIGAGIMEAVDAFLGWREKSEEELEEMQKKWEQRIEEMQSRFESAISSAISEGFESGFASVDLRKILESELKRELVSRLARIIVDLAETIKLKSGYGFEGLASQLQTFINRAKEYAQKQTEESHRLLAQASENLTADFNTLVGSLASYFNLLAGPLSGLNLMFGGTSPWFGGGPMPVTVIGGIAAPQVEIMPAPPITASVLAAPALAATAQKTAMHMSDAARALDSSSESLATLTYYARETSTTLRRIEYRLRAQEEGKLSPIPLQEGNIEPREFFGGRI